MIETCQWGVLNRNADFSLLPIEDKVDLFLLGVSEMIRNTEELRAAIARGEAELFALRDNGVEIPGSLDVNQVVVIAATYGQEVLVLDYSKGKTPRVVATHYEMSRLHWVEVASSFDDLVNILRLSVT